MKTIRCPEGFEVCTVEGKGRGVFARRDLQAGLRVCVCSGYITDMKNITAMCLQLDANVFLQGVGEFDDFINHSCDPNCVIRFEGETPVLFVLKNMLEGEELTFDYNTTDWDMYEQEASANSDIAFSCRCGTAKCVGDIKGFRYLSDSQRSERKDCLSPFLQSRFSHP